MFSNKKIPDVFHFIWLGGLIPCEYKRTIDALSQVARKRRFTVNLWVDDVKNYENSKPRDIQVEALALKNKIFATKENLMQSRAGLLYMEYIDGDYTEEQYQEKLAKLEQQCDQQLLLQYQREYGILKKEVSSDLRGQSSNGPTDVTVKNIAELSDLLEEEFDAPTVKALMANISREMIGLKNFAAASDLLRYAILYSLGGWYSDTDTKFFVDKISDLISEENELGFKANCLFDQYERAVTICNNDLIGAIPKHDILRACITMSLDRYNQTYRENKMQDKRKPADSTSSLKAQMTIKISGPGLLSDAINGYCAANKLSAEQVAQIPIVETDVRGKGKVCGVHVGYGRAQTWLKKETSSSGPIFFTTESLQPENKEESCSSTGMSRRASC